MRHDPMFVPQARRRAHRFLTDTAPRMWQTMLDADVEFTTPDEIANLPARDRARWLARAEAQRVAKASLFHLDEGATTTAVYAGVAMSEQGYVLRRDLLPSEYGMLVWADDVRADVDGAPIAACHWQARDDSVWVAWWTDTASLTERHVADGTWTRAQADQVLAAQGLLAYEREAQLRYVTTANPVMAPDDEQADGAARALISTTIASWMMLANPAVRRTQLPAPAGLLGGLPAIAGSDDSVTALTLNPTGGA